jgi:hypothetical protein
MLKGRALLGASNLGTCVFPLAMKSVEKDGNNLSTLSSRRFQFLKFHNGGFWWYSQICLSA